MLFILFILINYKFFKYNNFPYYLIHYNNINLFVFLSIINEFILFFKMNNHSFNILSRKYLYLIFNIQIIMMPITNYNDIKIKIYSTNKGIKIVDSPIKIQILNILDGQVSEAEIVSKTGKSKSTISVHLKNLIDEGIINYKSHPLDRRSKLFYVVSDYIGEIYPDKIINKSPEITDEINNKEKLYFEVFRQFKSTLLLHGLQLEPLEVATGQIIGKSLHEEFKYETLEELLEQIKEKFEQLGLGELKVSSVEPLIFKNNDCKECFNIQYNLPTCNMTKGILKGILEIYYGKEIFIEEVECISKFDDSCTFIVDL